MSELMSPTAKGSAEDKLRLAIIQVRSPLDTAPSSGRLWKVWSDFRWKCEELGDDFERVSSRASAGSLRGGGAHARRGLFN